MKLAAGIIGIILGLLVLLQSCAVATTAGLASNESATEAGMIGIFVALLYFVGGAFAFGLPIVATIVFAIAALFALTSAGEFTDLGIWGYVALALAVMSFFAWWSSRRAKVKPENAQ